MTSKDLHITCHRSSGHISCFCGETISSYYEHECVVDLRIGKLIFTACPEDCSNCKKIEADKICASQWRVDEDGYTICVICDLKSYSSLPKSCACSWYVDDNGKMRCKDCRGIIDGGVDFDRDCSYDDYYSCPEC